MRGRSYRTRARTETRPLADDISRLNAALEGRYAIDREIGRGGAASVYLAEDLRHGRKVAIKVLRPAVAAQVGADRFLREITIAAQLHHSHILPLHDSGDADGVLYYVMPYIEGHSLRGRLAEDGRLGVAEAVRVLRDVVDALDHAHQRGVVHRDIKPENVLLSGRDAWVTDFGVAKVYSATSERPQDSTAGMALGTPAYMSPEQASADPHVDHRADIYALGVLGYELLTGTPPFTGRTPRQILAAHLTEIPEPIQDRRPDVPKTLAAILERCLAKEPADRWQSAAELMQYLESHVTPEGTTPQDTRPIAPVSAPRRRRTLALAAVGALALVAAFFALRAPAASGLDANLLAVAPFDVLVPAQELWREGMVDVLSASLDGAGPLRSVSPSVVISRWDGRADPASAQRLGRDLGAGLVVYGRIISTGEDSIRLAASLYDVGGRNVIGEVELRDQVANIDRLADSLAVRLMSDLSSRRGIGSVQLQSFGSTNPAALKAFLQGEHHYRSAGWDSARAYYARAIHLDRSFALAYSRMGRVHEWRKGGDRSVPYALRAGALNAGLAPRESLLITVDSIDAALYAFTGDTTGWSLLERLFGTLNFATDQYPLDPGVWYRLGEARYHWGASAGISERLSLAAFERSVELDSSFAPAYIHLIELAAKLDGVTAGQRAIDAYLARQPAGQQPRGIALARELLGGGTFTSESLDSALDVLSDDALRSAAAVTARLPDSLEAAIQIARAAYRREQTEANQRSLAWTVAFHGKLLEAHALADPADVGLYSELALLGTIPVDTASRVFAGWLFDREGEGIWHALPWWAAHGEAASIDQAMRLWDSLREKDGLTPADTAEINHLVNTAGAYLALSAGDTTAALRRFAALQPWPWEPYYRERLTYARLLAAQGRDREAANLLDQIPVPASESTHPGEVLWQLERARVNERLGNTEVAIWCYRFVADLWYAADASLQPFVDEALLALRRLTRDS